MRDTNPKPHLTRYLAQIGAFKDDPLRVLDVGARGGLEAHWQLFGNDIRMVGFEPDVEECDRLNATDSHSLLQFYPVALHRDRSVRKFNILANPPSSSFYEPDEDFWSRFPDARNLQIVRTTELETVDLDSYAEEVGIQGQDYIKMDVEGAEFDVLSGARKSLETVLGLSLEVEFRPISHGQVPFAGVDEFLRDAGFYLFDMWPHKNARKVMSPAVYWNNPGQTGTGQLFWAHVLYLRDPIEQIKREPTTDLWPKTRLLKMASLMEIANLNDCAAEVVEYLASADMVTSSEREKMLDLLAFGGDGKQGAFERFQSRARSEARKVNRPRGKKRTTRQVAMSMTPSPIWNLMRSVKHSFKG
ncbi:MAG: FkbM family methyltransferase [Chloroflexi bacterium]|nr:FkbM family methyltransferase [Chloroflexota bacterium]